VTSSGECGSILSTLLTPGADTTTGSTTRHLSNQLRILEKLSIRSRGIPGSRTKASISETASKNDAHGAGLDTAAFSLRAPSLISFCRLCGVLKACKSAPSRRAAVSNSFNTHALSFCRCVGPLAGACAGGKPINPADIYIVESNHALAFNISRECR
jgi:hypothetical protein